MKNITYCHEHIVIDLTAKGTDDCYLNLYEEAKDELVKLKQLGVTRIVDCSNHGIGVNHDINKRIQQEIGIEIINSTGFYKDPFLPSYVTNSTVEELANIMLNDIKNGCKVIGEIGTSKDEITENERKIFEASCIAQKQTGAVIITHTTLGTMALEQIEIFKRNNVDLTKVIISHLALKNDLNLIIKVLKEGCNVAFDTIGKLSYLSDEIRADFITELCKLGYEKQLLMSMDLTRKSHPKKNGGVGYSYLIEEFLPLLRNRKIEEEKIETIMCSNFSRIMGE